ncbi:MAG: IclR family transcriptional regulator [Actinomycetia bacterium]|nr:IclR family transcriptional regulator [Actinomycetes bacterium]
MSQVPAAMRALRVLRFLAGQPGPVPADRIAREIGMPRSSAYHLLNEMIAEGFVVHVADDRGYGLGLAAFEAGSGFARQEPLQRLARRPLAELSTGIRQTAHLAVMHGRDVLYVIEQRYPGRPMLVTDVGVRLPAHLTASGRAILAGLPKSQVRALFPGRAAFVNRTGAGPASLAALQSVLGETRARGYAVEEGEVTPGLASVAVAVRDHNRYPVAAVTVTYAGDAGQPALAARLTATADAITRRIGG